jgi:hypothetical protein
MGSRLQGSAAYKKRKFLAFEVIMGTQVSQLKTLEGESFSSRGGFHCFFSGTTITFGVLANPTSGFGQSRKPIS